MVIERQGDLCPIPLRIADSLFGERGRGTGGESTFLSWMITRWCSAGLTSMPGTHPDIEVVGAASSGEQALEMLRSRPVDLVLRGVRSLG